MPRPEVVFLDHNVWDFLLARRLDLVAELPSDQFTLRITREAEFEISALTGRSDKSDLRAYIAEQLTVSQVATDSHFGFFDSRFSAEDQRVSGFGQGRWAFAEEIEFATKLKYAAGSLRRTGLFKNEADLALAARSMIATVLTFDGKKGPLRKAFEVGGDVIFLTEFDASGLALAEYIKTRSRRT